MNVWKQGFTDDNMTRKVHSIKTELLTKSREAMISAVGISAGRSFKGLV